MLTDIKCRAAASEGRTVRKLPDAEGLYLWVYADGRKYWRLRYWLGGREKSLSLGVYPAVGLKDARLRRNEARALLANGVNPAMHRKLTQETRRQAAADSFEAVAREWLGRKGANWAPSHTVKVVGRLERNVYPWLGARPVAEITAREVLAVLRRIETRGAIETAHRARQDIGQVLRYAVSTGRAERDPTGDLRGALAAPVGKHFAAVTDPAKIGGLLRVLDHHPGTFPVACALRLAPLLFVRPGELRKAEWAHIDLDAGEWRFFVTKVKTEHVVPLATQAVGILRELHALTGHGRYVFPNGRTPGGDRAMSENAVLGAMRRAGIGKDEMSGHGFRAMARTVLDEVLGFRIELIEHQMSHAVRDPLGRAYNRTTHLPERRKMMQAWADYLDGLKSGADVLPLRRKGA